MSQPLDLEYRRLKPELAPGLARLFEALAEQGDDRFFHPHPFTPEEARRICGLRGEDLYYAAVAGQTVLAYGMLRGWDEGYAVPSLGIGVHPRARGCGLAQSFMQFLHAAAAARGASRIRLKVYPENRPARQLYEKLGYQFTEAAADGQLLGVLTLDGRGKQAAARFARRIDDHLSLPGPAPAPKPEPERRLPAAQVWAEVQRLLGLPAEAFVRGLYPLLLGRPADLAGLVGSLTSLASGASRADVVRCMAGSGECRRAGTDTSWLARLDEPPPSSPAAPGVVPDAVVDAELLAIPDRDQFVSQAYRAILGRPPNPDELRKHSWRLRFLPFYKRRLVLRRLRGSEEKRQRDRREDGERVVGALAAAEARLAAQLAAGQGLTSVLGPRQELALAGAEERLAGKLDDLRGGAAVLAQVVAEQRQAALLLRELRAEARQAALARRAAHAETGGCL